MNYKYILGLPMDVPILQRYNLHCQFTNQRNDSIVVKWIEGNTRKQMIVPPRSSRDYKTLFVAIKSVPPVNFAVHDLKSGNVLLINGSENIKVQPTKKEVLKELFILSEGINLISIFSHGGLR